VKREVLLSPAARGRLDRALADALGVGRAAVKDAFAAKLVRVGGRPARASDEAQPGALVEIDLALACGVPLADSALPLAVLGEGSGWLVADKPAGLATHPLRDGEMGTLANAVAARYPRCASASPEARDGGSLQRLDFETSGCVLFAKDRAAWEVLRAQLSERTMEKTYLALVVGRVPVEGVCSVALAQRGGRVVAVPDPLRPPRGARKPRAAETRFCLRQQYAEHALLEVRIMTGVMHQVRAHLAFLGHPVAGDLVYGGPAAALDGLGRQFLHASALSFERPEGGRVRVESPLPRELAGMLSQLEGD